VEIVQAVLMLMSVAALLVAAHEVRLARRGQTSALAEVRSLVERLDAERVVVRHMQAETPEAPAVAAENVHTRATWPAPEARDAELEMAPAGGWDEPPGLDGRDTPADPHRTMDRRRPRR